MALEEVGAPGTIKNLAGFNFDRNCLFFPKKKPLKFKSLDQFKKIWSLRKLHHKKELSALLLNYLRYEQEPHFSNKRIYVISQHKFKHSPLIYVINCLNSLLIKLIEEYL